MDMVVDLIIDPFGYGFMLRALYVSVLVGIVCPILGAFVVTRGLAFMGDAMSHAVLPGLVVAFMLGVSPFLAAVPAGMGVAFLIGIIARRTGVSQDTSIGILFAGLFALGLALLATAKGISVDLEDLLLGQVLAVSGTDVYITAGLVAVVLVVLYALNKELVFTSFDPVGASVAGLHTARLDYLLLVLLALVIVIALQAVGIVLVMAMLVTPAATASLLARSFIRLMVIGAVLGALAAVAGLYISFYADLPSGPSMTLVATAEFVVVAALRKRTTA
ncbi:MAG: metal ABC transporter permease [SAR202 cluster bacterium]|jgi:ABC-type Mn2+/Zn2+ transport system permease subunit|nr:metal ABC transporter permease [SAR202 cluster bacterium]